MATTDVNVTSLTQETYSTLDGSEQVIMFDSAEGKRATVAAVGEYVLKKLTTSLNGSTQTVAAALSSLNSDIRPTSITNVTDWADNCGAGISNGIIETSNSTGAGAPISGAYKVVCWKYSSATIFVTATLISSVYFAEYTFRKYGGNWIEEWLDSGNVISVALARSEPLTVYAPKGSIIITSRKSNSRGSIFMRDYWNGIVKLSSVGTDDIEITVSNNNIAITNNNSSGAEVVTVIRPHKTIS